MRSHYSFFLMVLMCLFVLPAGGQECVYKWTQQPNMTDGFDVESWVFGATDTVVADDWLCTDPEPVSCIRWWGSYVGWATDTMMEVPPPDFPPITGFLLSWHEYIPGPPYSMPGVLLEEELCTDFTVEWFGPVEMWDNPGFFEHEYIYEATLETAWPQIPGTTYFLNIQAVYAEDPSPFYPWGWKNSEERWNDDAVFSEDGGMTWFDMVWPPGHRLEGISMDMAFEVGIVQADTPTPTSTATFTPTAEDTPTYTPTATFTPTAEDTPTQTPTPTVPPVNWKDYNGPTSGGRMPDFDQKQNGWGSPPTGPTNWTFCGPVAEANSLWWFDLTGLYGDVVESASPWVLINDLAGRMGTTPLNGTTIRNLYDGVESYLADSVASASLEVHFIPTDASSAVPQELPVLPPMWEDIVFEVDKCQDVVLLLGFWVVDTTSPVAGGFDIDWRRSGGHYVTCAGVSAASDYHLAISDPYLDAFYSGAIVKGATQGENHNVPDGHNDGVSASHDIYEVTVVLHPNNQYGRSPGGWVELLGYPATVGTLLNFENANEGVRFGATFWPLEWGPPPGSDDIFVEVEGAVAVSPIETDIIDWRFY